MHMLQKMLIFTGSIAIGTTAPVLDHEIFYFYTTQCVYWKGEICKPLSLHKFQILQSGSDFLAKICVDATNLYWSSSPV